MDALLRLFCHSEKTDGKSTLVQQNAKTLELRSSSHFRQGAEKHV